MTETKKVNPQGRYWCFTNYNLEFDYTQLDFSYIIVGVETCPTTGRWHHQGYVEFGGNQRFNKLKSYDDTIHWERRKEQMNNAKSIEYCKKEGNYYEAGIPMEYVGKGKRTDLVVLKDLIKAGKDDYEIVEETTSLSVVKSIDIVRGKMIPARSTPPLVKWYWGETGTGKTRQAVEDCNGEYDTVDYMNNFFIGYRGSKTVIFDDFRGGIPLNLLLRITDRYKTVINIKGGSSQWSPDVIIFTSSKSPEDCYPNCGENIFQLLRRISEIREFTHCVGWDRGPGNTIPDLDDEDLQEH